MIENVEIIQKLETIFEVDVDGKYHPCELVRLTYDTCEQEYAISSDVSYTPLKNQTGGN